MLNRYDTQCDELQTFTPNEHSGRYTTTHKSNHKLTVHFSQSFRTHLVNGSQIIKYLYVLIYFSEYSWMYSSMQFMYPEIHGIQKIGHFLPLNYFSSTGLAPESQRIHEAHLPEPPQARAPRDARRKQNLFKFGIPLGWWVGPARNPTF